jgi:uncharacterized protein (TIGR02588 family)
VKGTRHLLEWTVLGLSVAAIAVLVSLLVYDGVTRTGDPRLEIVLSPAQSQGDSWIVPLEVVNRGAAAAANVDIEVALSDGERELETSTVTLPFVPEGSEIDAVVVFSENPSGRETVARVLGYELP